MMQTTDRPAAATAERYDPPYGWAALAALAVFALYAITLAPTTQFWDTSEYIATAHILGIPHPPGNPTFVFIARAWELLLSFTGLSVAVRINLFSATMSALAHGLWFLMVHRILSFYSDDRVFRLVGAAAAVLLSATAFTVWNQSNVNAKVYTVSLFTIALISWLVFRWRDTLARFGRGTDWGDRLLLIIIYALALSVGNHLMAFLVAPALVLFVLLVEWRTFTRWQLYAAGLLAVVLGLSTHMFLPIRAALDPVINEANPTCPSVFSALASIFTLGQAGCENLSEVLTRQQYDKVSIFANPVRPGVPRGISMIAAQMVNYLYYFDWQWARSLAGNEAFFGFPRPLVTLVFTALGLYGAWSHYKTDKPSFWYVLVLFFTVSVALVIYLNFEYGYSQPVPEGLTARAREVRERDYFFIVSFSLWGLWAGMGLTVLWGRLTERFRHMRKPRPRALAAPLLAIAFVPLVLNWSWATRANQYAARDFAYNLLMSVEPYGVLFTNGDNDTFPLWYLQEVEGIRQDVTVIVTSYLNTAWYAKQLKQLTTPCPPGMSAEDDPTVIICQRRFESEMQPAFWATALIEPETVEPEGPITELPGTIEPESPVIELPDHSILPISEEQIEKIANTRPFYVRAPLTFTAGDIETTIETGTLLVPADLFMTIILRSIDDRPIYFSSTTRAYRKFNLQPYLVRKGLAYELHNGPIPRDTTDAIVPLPESRMSGVVGPYIHLPRTDSLLWNIFIHRGGIPDEWEHWVDPATQSIPFYYAYTHLAAAQAHAVKGEPALRERHLERVDEWIELGRE